MRPIAVLAVCLAVVGVAGCGQERSELVAFRLQGGIAGLDYRLTVQRDGRAAILDPRTDVPRRRFRVSARRLRRLTAALEAAGFTRVRLPDLPCRAVADGFSYSITYRSRTRRGGTGCEREDLDRAFSELRRIEPRGNR